MTDRGGHKGRTGADAVLVAALAAGSTAAEAAQIAGVSERTVVRRLSDPDFRRCVEVARSEIVERAVIMVSGGAIMATQTLFDLMRPEVPPSVRLNAAKAVLDAGIRLHAELDLTKRLDATNDPGTNQTVTIEEVWAELECVRAERERRATRADLLRRAEESDREASRLRAMAALRSSV